MRVRLYVQIEDNEPLCLGEGDIAIPTSTRGEAMAAVAELFREAGDVIKGEAARELD